MSEPIKQALTREEWELVAPVVTHLFAANGMVYVQGSRIEGRRPGIPALVVGPDTERHALAALALYGQPFGFTREDVTRLRRIADFTGTLDEDGAILNALADRIEALLPPEGTAVDRELAVDPSVALTKNAPASDLLPPVKPTL